ncbi:hypothetical protein RLOatenuis_1790 [Rickettsiales bacterium]|nr:hypothetical protein RLOatenuis_1790 [Rickettsiales bacterium]
MIANFQSTYLYSVQEISADFQGILDTVKQALEEVSEKLQEYKEISDLLSDIKNPEAEKYIKYLSAQKGRDALKETFKNIIKLTKGKIKALREQGLTQDMEDRILSIKDDNDIKELTKILKDNLFDKCDPDNLIYNMPFNRHQDTESETIFNNVSYITKEGILEATKTARDLESEYDKIIADCSDKLEEIITGFNQKIIQSENDKTAMKQDYYNQALREYLGYKIALSDDLRIKAYVYHKDLLYKFMLNIIEKLYILEGLSAKDINVKDICDFVTPFVAGMCPEVNEYLNKDEQSTPSLIVSSVER